jgi:hypothetical protein
MKEQPLSILSSFYDCVTSHLQQIRSPLPQNIPALNKQLKNLSYAGQQDHTPQIRHPLSHIVDINEIISPPGEQISARHRFESLS